MVKHTATSVVTIERFIIEEERNHPEATGELSGILYDLALAAKMIHDVAVSLGPLCEKCLKTWAKELRSN